MQSQFLSQVQIQGQSKTGIKPFPKVYSPATASNNFMHLQEYFQNYSQQILREVSQEGAVFFRGFQVKSPTEMASVLNRLGLESFQYIGGAAVRKLIVGNPNQHSPKTQIFTTNQSPPQQPIPFHNQLMQTPNYPQFLSFYCYREADEGGATPLLNCHQMYNFISQKFPEFIQKLEQKKLRYIRVVGKEDNPNSPIGRGWKNIFKCDSKEEVEGKMKEGGYQWEWLGNQEEDLRLISKPLPGVRVSKLGKKVFCNQFAVFKGWVDNKNQPSKALRYGDFSQISLQVLEAIYEHAYKIKASIEWKVGDFVLIDNEMSMHAREPFKGVNRKIYASLFKTPTPKQSLLTLKSGDEMPIVGFGTWKLPNNVAEQIIYNAIKCGYRLIDCAGVYGNQVEVGKGIRRAITQGIVRRNQIFVTSKVWNTFHKPQHVRQACKRTLSDLGLDYLDLYLIHYPIAQKYVDPAIAYPTVFQHVPKPTQGPTILLEKVPIIDTWRAMQQLVEQGCIRNIGVSNFNISLLRDLINSAKIHPSVNQVQIHPFLTQKKLIKFCQQNCVQVTSYSTMGGASYVELNFANKEQLIVETEVVRSLMEKYNKTGPQILFRWAVQQGLAIIPKTSQVKRLKQNIDVFGWAIEEEDMKKIDGLERGKRYCDPGNFLGEELALQVFCWE